MKKISVFFAGTIILAAIIALSSYTPLPPGPSANGQGTLTAGGPTRHFSFHVNTMPDGSVKGSGVLHRIGGVIDIKFDINCLTIVGNEARMSGVITSFKDNPEFEGTGCRFRVVDNGEGANASPDQMSLLNLGQPPGIPCNTNTLALFSIEGGNIQVKP